MGIQIKSYIKHKLKNGARKCLCRKKISTKDHVVCDIDQ